MTHFVLEQQGMASENKNNIALNQEYSNGCPLSSTEKNYLYIRVSVTLCGQMLAA